LKPVFLIKRKRTKGALIFALLLAPLVAYAVYVLVLVLLDSFRGDGLILHQYVFESRRLLVLRFMSDSRQALPVFYATGLLLWLEIHLLSRLGDWSGVLPAALAGALTGFAVAAIFVELGWGVVAPAVAAGLLMSLLLAWAVRPSGSPA
jgi:hypothetical protein